MTKQSAYERLIEIIKVAGYSEREAKDLLALFLQEEAKTYLECMDIHDEDIENIKKFRS